MGIDLPKRLVRERVETIRVQAKMPFTTRFAIGMPMLRIYRFSENLQTLFWVGKSWELLTTLEPTYIAKKILKYSSLTVQFYHLWLSEHVPQNKPRVSMEDLGTFTRYVFRGSQLS